MAGFMKNITLVSQSAALYREQNLKVEGITGYQAKYLLAILKEEGISQDKLAKSLFVNKSNVARQLSLLENGGYVKRVQSEDDKRAMQVYLTDSGRELCVKIREINTRWRQVVLDGFSEEETDIICALLERMVDNAKGYMEKVL
jgi:DNA-binding MarR family transcriptional regulator